MIQLFLVLCGSRLIRQQWWLLLLLGAVWVFLGAFLFLDALDGALWAPLIYFTLPLALGGVWALASSFDAVGVAKTLRLAKAAVCLLVIGLILLAPDHSGVTIGILVGLFLCANGGWRGFCAWVIRYDGWQGGLLFAAFELLFGAWSFVPWPTAWEGEVGIDVGALLLFTGLGMCVLALRIRRLPPDRSVLSIVNPGETAFGIDANS
ncbi:MAG: protease, partial [Proteobacteria bacterium]|nr:protease [Pseudomonadota bacterium]